MQTIPFPLTKTQALACLSNDCPIGQAARAPSSAADSNTALVLDTACARLELLAHEAEADARQFNALRQPDAAAGCRLEADALRLSAEYLREQRGALPDWCEGVHTGSDLIAFQPSHGIARTVASFRPACEVLLDYACQLHEQATDAARSDKVIAGGFRAESTALRFAAAVLSQEQPATAADLAA